MNKIKLVSIGMWLFILGYEIRYLKIKMTKRYDRTGNLMDQKLNNLNKLLTKRQTQFKEYEERFAEQLAIVVKEKNA